MLSCCAEKQAALNKFWQSRNTSAATIANEVRSSFYARWDDASDKFSGEKCGWQTAFDHVFLLHGPPDEIAVDTRMTAPQPFQVWRYHRSRREFLFVDRMGEGSYQLAFGQD
ncbi:GWxTD domain-containing protein [candidate division KSB1 bacterium]|nr:GWxTD domain-containing protein [candidate division KSB1 bacterium]